MIKCLSLGAPHVMRGFNRTVIVSIEKEIPEDHMKLIGWYNSDVRLDSAEALEDTDVDKLHKTFAEAEEESNDDTNVYAVFNVSEGWEGAMASAWLVNAVKIFGEAIEHANKKYHEANN